MQQVLAIALAAMHQDMNRMDATALNLANVSTPGFKREVVATRPFVDVLADAAGADVSVPGAVSDGTSGGMSALVLMFDGKQGTLKMTGGAFDVALSGEGFLEVQTEAGTAYTRQGDLRVDAQGRLVTAQGLAVMGKAGEIFVTTPNPVIDQAGNITEPDAAVAASAPGTPVAQIKVVRFDDTTAMRHLGNGLLTAGSGMSVAKEGEAGVRQGALENSNVSSMQEMVGMIQTMRHFESVQRITQGYDDMVGTAIHKLGDLS